LIASAPLGNKHATYTTTAPASLAFGTRRYSWCSCAYRRCGFARACGEYRSAALIPLNNPLYPRREINAPDPDDALTYTLEGDIGKAMAMGYWISDQIFIEMTQNRQRDPAS
jgi:hypothetical protein